MSNWNEEAARHKAMRRGQIDAKVVSGKGKRKPRPWRVMAPPFFAGMGGDFVAHRAVDKEAAVAWVEKQKRSYYMTRQDQSERASGQAQKVAKSWADRLWIVGPGDIA